MIRNIYHENDGNFTSKHTVKKGEIYKITNPCEVLVDEFEKVDTFIWSSDDCLSNDEDIIDPDLEQKMLDIVDEMSANMEEVLVQRAPLPKSEKEKRVIVNCTIDEFELEAGYHELKIDSYILALDDNPVEYCFIFDDDDEYSKHDIENNNTGDRESVFGHRFLYANKIIVILESDFDIIKKINIRK